MLGTRCMGIVLIVALGGYKHLHRYVPNDSIMLPRSRQKTTYKTEARRSVVSYCDAIHDENLQFGIVRYPGTS